MSLFTGKDILLSEKNNIANSISKHVLMPQSGLISFHLLHSPLTGHEQMEYKYMKYVASYEHS